MLKSNDAKSAIDLYKSWFGSPRLGLWITKGSKTSPPETEVRPVPKRLTLAIAITATLALFAASLAAQNPISAESRAGSMLPHLQKNGQAVQMMVAGKPYLMLAGELHNSSASNQAYMEPIWEKLSDLNVNTVVSTVSWELVEPAEGKFDFSTVDFQIAAAQQHGLHLVLIWFGTWKNASSSYTPLWVKRDPQHFPMATTKTGTGTFMGVPAETLSAFGPATIAADAQAFRALMRHIRETDTQHTVIMMQVENETGLLGDSRDRSKLADAAWAAPVPPQLLSYMSQHKDTLLPELKKVWFTSGFKTSGTWAEVFGTDSAAEEVFMAWYVGHAVNTVAEAGKAELALPMYANAWLGPQPHADTAGQYPSGGPVTGMLDVWRAAAPALALFSPDIYVADFQGVVERQVRSGNSLFIPEARANVANLFWAVGHHSALGFSPFGIEEMTDSKPLAKAYAELGGVAPLLLKYQAEGKVMALIEGNESSVKQFESATGLTVKFSSIHDMMVPPKNDKAVQKDLPPAPGADDFFVKPEPDQRGFALILQTAPDEFFIIGSKILLIKSRSHLGTVDEGSFVNGAWVQGRRLNGDETFSGNFATLPSDAIQARKIVTYPVR